MQPAHDVEFRDRLAPALARAMPHLFERHGVRMRVLGALAERAQTATGHAHVRGVDVPIHIEVSGRAVQALAHQVRHVAERKNIGGLIQSDAIVIRKALAVFDFLENRTQARIVNYDFHRISAAQNTKDNMVPSVLDFTSSGMLLRGRPRRARSLAAGRHGSPSLYHRSQFYSAIIGRPITISIKCQPPRIQRTTC